MTAEQWASELEARLNGTSLKEWRSIIVETIREAIAESVDSLMGRRLSDAMSDEVKLLVQSACQVEREACAKTAENTQTDIAAAIRSRGPENWTMSAVDSDPCEFIGQKARIPARNK